MSFKDKHFAENDQIFYFDGFRLAQSAIGKGLSNVTLFSAIELMYEAIDALNDSIIALAERHNMNVACHKGCHWCCHQAVYANSYELYFLSEKIKKRFSSEKIAIFLEAAKKKAGATSQMNEIEIARYKSACPLLENGACSTYKYRPMACRIYLSYKLETCLQYYHHPENENDYPALIDLPLRAGRMMNEGFLAALKEYGIETTEFRFEEGLRAALQTDQQLFG